MENKKGYIERKNGKIIVYRHNGTPTGLWLEKNGKRKYIAGTNGKLKLATLHC